MSAPSQIPFISPYPIMPAPVVGFVPLQSPLNQRVDIRGDKIVVQKEEDDEGEVTVTNTLYFDSLEKQMTKGEYYQRQNIGLKKEKQKLEQEILSKGDVIQQLQTELAVAKSKSGIKKAEDSQKIAEDKQKQEEEQRKIAEAKAESLEKQLEAEKKAKQEVEDKLKEVNEKLESNEEMIKKLKDELAQKNEEIEKEKKKKTDLIAEKDKQDESIKQYLSEIQKLKESEDAVFMKLVDQYVSALIAEAKSRKPSDELLATGLLNMTSIPLAFSFPPVGIPTYIITAIAGIYMDETEKPNHICNDYIAENIKPHLIKDRENFVKYPTETIKKWRNFLTEEWKKNNSK